MLELKNISSGYGKNIVLDDINLAFEKGSLVSIVGKNGCGKTTLLKNASGFVSPFSGDVTVDGISLSCLNSQKRALKISYLAQSRIVADMTVEQLVLHGRFAHLKYPRIYGDKDREIAKDAMIKMEVYEFAHKKLSELSGGMCQKAYLAMALTQCADYILLDEPTTHLDISHKFTLMKTLSSLAKDGKAIVAVLHDISLAMEFSDKIVLMNNGKVLQVGTPCELFEKGYINRAFGIELKRVFENGRYFYYNSFRE